MKEGENREKSRIKESSNKRKQEASLKLGGRFK